MAWARCCIDGMGAVSLWSAVSRRRRGGDLWEVPGPRRRAPGPGERPEPPERSVSKAAHAQLILFCGRSGPETARTGSSRVYGVRGVILGPAGARFHFSRIERKIFRRRFHTGADSMRRWRLPPPSKRLRLPSSASGDETRSSELTRLVLRARGWPL